MKKIKLLQEPGFLWDLYYIFYLKFNYVYLSKFVFERENEKSVNDHSEILTRFCEFSDDLFVFFHIFSDDNSTFIYNYYLKRYEKDFLKYYNLNFMQQELSDSDQVVKNMILFCFNELDDNELEKCLNSKELLFGHIKMSSYSTEEKLKLYEFFINLPYYIHLFQRTLVDQCLCLSSYYKEHYKEIINAYDLEILYKLNGRFGKNIVDNDEKTRVEEYVSYCIIDRLHFEIFSNSKNYLYMLGSDYEHESNDNKEINSKSLLEKTCYALCEKSRINILYLLLERKEMTCKDVTENFDFSSSTAYHHLSLMEEMGLIITRREGRTVFYRVNKRRFNDMSEYLKQFIY